MKKKNPLLKTLVVILDIVLVLVVINFIPAMFLKVPGMKEITGTYVTVHYQKEKEAATDVYSLLEEQAPYLLEMAGAVDEKHVNVYIYDKQTTMRMKRYGVLGAFVKMDGYIGECKGTNIIMVSPANPGKLYTEEEVENNAVYELMSCYLSQINEKLSLWLKEGTILYVMNGTSYREEDKADLDEIRIPELEEIETGSEEKFKEIHGFAYAPLYVEFLDSHYGWDAVSVLLETQDYEQAFSKSKEEVYGEFREYMESYYG